MRAFTLIETLIYLALFSLLVTGAIASLIAIRGSTSRIEASARLTDEGHFILERLRYEVERADSIEIISSSHLSIKSDSDTVSFYLDGGALIEKANGNDLPLTEPTTIVHNLVLDENTDRGISISFELQVLTDEGTSFSDTFSGTLYPMNLP